MRYKLLGKSGLRVSELALGTMTFGDDWGWGASEEVMRGLDDLVRAGKFYMWAFPMPRPGSSLRRTPWPTCEAGHALWACSFNTI
jgi:aryl-alcohol dehydrogenase-like predicted oxidoreductase